MSKLAYTAVFLLIATAAVAAEAAAPSTTVTIPWGDWVANGIVGMKATLLLVANWIMAAFVPTVFKQYITRQVLERAINYAVAMVEDAARGKKHDVVVTNEIIAAAAKYVVEQEPRIARWLGDTLSTRIAARLAANGMIADDVSAKNIVLPVPETKKPA